MGMTYIRPLVMIACLQFFASEALAYSSHSHVGHGHHGPYSWVGLFVTLAFFLLVSGWWRVVAALGLLGVTELWKKVVGGRS
jgi:hypothetical protein